MLFYFFTFLSQIDNTRGLQQPDSSSSGFPLNQILMFAMMMIVVFIVMRSTAKRTVYRQKNKGKTAQEIVKAQLKENPYHTIDRLQELMAALSDMSREINGQIDNRTAKLEILLTQADKKIQKYQDILDSIRAEQARPNNFDDKMPLPAEPVGLEPLTTMDLEIKEVNTVELKSVEQTASTGKIDIISEDEPEEIIPKKQENSFDNSSEKKQIIDLAQSGTPISEISRITGRPSGEVELILNLSGIKYGK